jgi:hypothetical protein
MNIAREIQKNGIKFIQEQTIENNLLLVKVLTFGIIYTTELKNIGSYMVFKKNVKTYFISHQSAN